MLYLWKAEHAYLQQTDRTRVILRLLCATRVSVSLRLSSCNIMCVAKLTSATISMLQKKRRITVNIFCNIVRVAFFFKNNIHVEKNRNTISIAKKFRDTTSVALKFCNKIFAHNEYIHLLAFWETGLLSRKKVIFSIHVIKLSKAQHALTRPYRARGQKDCQWLLSWCWGTSTGGGLV